VDLLRLGKFQDIKNIMHAHEVHEIMKIHSVWHVLMFKETDLTLYTYSLLQAKYPKITKILTKASDSLLMARIYFPFRWYGVAFLRKAELIIMGLPRIFHEPLSTQAPLESVS